MRDVLLIFDAKLEKIPVFGTLWSMFSVRSVPFAEVRPEDITRATCLVVHSCLGSAEDVRHLERLAGGARLRDQTIFLSPDTGRTAQVQAHSIGIERIFDPRSREADIVAAVSAVLEQSLDRQLETCSRQIASAIKQSDLLHRRLCSAMRGKKPLPMAALDQSAASICDAVEDEGFARWLKAIELHHGQTCRHMMNVAGTAVAFGRYLGLPRVDLLLLAQAGLLHDVGKLFIPISVLEKDGPLTEAERALIACHPEHGAKALAGEQGVDQQVIEAALNHHEYLDGSGYPNRISGDAISPLVRLLTIVDIFAALTERRAYKEPMTARMAIGHLMQMRGKLDQPLLRAFRGLVLEPVFAVSKAPEPARSVASEGCLTYRRHPLGEVA